MQGLMSLYKGVDKMGYFKPTIDETGLHLPTYQDVLDRLNERTRAIFGNDIYLEPDSQDYQANAEVADLWADMANLVQQTYNNRAIQTAQGVSIDGLLKINGLKRLSASNSVCIVTVEGIAGTPIIGGLITDRLNTYIWQLENTVIPAGGTVDITATCQTAGNIYADVGELNKIITQTNGWLSVINEANAIPGKPIENDPAVKARQAVSTTRPSKTVLQGLIGGIAEITNVQRYMVYENDTNVTDDNGIPGHCICCVVEGGDADVIGNEVYLRKTPGCDTYGDVEVIIVSPSPMLGEIPPINFFRPSYVPIFVQVKVNQRTGFVDTMETEIKERIVDFINTLDIGENVSVSLIGAIAQSVVPDLRSPTFTLDPSTPILLGITEGSLSENDIEIGFNKAAQCTIGSVEVVYV
jgi:uncharacterized phage protein gp47/JayE